MKDLRKLLCRILAFLGMSFGNYEALLQQRISGSWIDIECYEELGGVE